VPEELKFRLITTKEGETLDQLIDQGRVSEAIVFCEVMLVLLENELAYIKKQLARIREVLGLEEGVEE
jgi:hypothetical protein